MAKRWCKDGKVEIKGQFFDLHKNTHIYVLTFYPLRQITDKILVYNNMNIHFLHKIERKTIFERTKKTLHTMKLYSKCMQCRNHTKAKVSY